MVYADGTFKNLLNYPENCISWLKFLRAKDEANPTYRLLAPFASQRISTIMHDMENIFKEFKGINDGKRGGDKIKIDTIESGSFPEEVTTKISKLMALLSTLTEWEYKQEKWTLSGLRVYNFSKDIIDGNLNNKNYIEIMDKEPLSFAITATKRMEYTLEEPDSI
ncbi:MAG: hypothetical protein A2W23_04600 [Planctomycetes bacterium RBG_16_43_13]|nr:MAG: hypothetical protein A2W23_04600 [Planctomycetes bacterium RBG_16_43_13]